MGYLGGMRPDYLDLNETPSYGLPEASAYLRLPYGVVREWVSKEGPVPAAGKNLLSFSNLLELHVLKALRKSHKLKMQSIRKGLGFYRAEFGSVHPLLDPRIETDGISLILREDDAYVNLSRAGQTALQAIVATYLRRIDTADSGRKDFFPFVRDAAEDEPRSIQISPALAFGKPVLAGTGISTEVVAGRFLARDSIVELAEEYRVNPRLIEEAIRWELPQIMHAA